MKIAVEPDRVLRRDEVLRMCGISRSTLAHLVKAGEFPAPVRISKRAVRWWLSDVAAWLESRPKTR